jgi:hypothetical protein
MWEIWQCEMIDIAEELAEARLRVHGQIFRRHERKPRSSV